MRVVANDHHPDLTAIDCPGCTGGWVPCECDQAGHMRRCRDCGGDGAVLTVSAYGPLWNLEGSDLDDDEIRKLKGESHGTDRNEPAGVGTHAA